MLNQDRLFAARAVAGFLLLAHICGLLFFSSFSSLWLAYAVLVIAALCVFCFLPRGLLRRVRGWVSGLAVAAICVTVPIAYQDFTLVNGADSGALELRGLLVAILSIMIIEARS